MQITKEKAHELRELLEDTVEYYCDQNMISGETAWTCVECLGIAKVAQIRGTCK